MVSYNKLGDLEYGLGNVEAAVNWYKHGLCIREEAVQGSQLAGPSARLDVAISTIKVADACQVRPFLLSAVYDTMLVGIQWHAGKISDC